MIGRLSIIIVCCVAMSACAGMPWYSQDRGEIYPDHLEIERQITSLPRCGTSELAQLEHRALQVELLPYGADDDEEDGFRNQNRSMHRVVREHVFMTSLHNEETGQDHTVHVLIPENFITDFASIPRLSRMFFSPVGRHAEASVAHDWLFAFGYPKSQGGENFADNVFHQAVIDADEWAPGRFALWLPMHIWPTGSYNSPAERRFYFASAEDEWVYRPTNEQAEMLHTATIRVCPEPYGDLEVFLDQLVPIER